MSDALVEHLAAGTGRREGLPHDDALVGEILAREGLREISLLLALGARAIERKAGFVPARDIAIGEPAPTDARKPSRPNAARLMSDMLSGVHDALLPEALDREARAGRRLPHALIAAALSATRREIRAKILPVLGERGRWVAAQDPAFSWAVELAPDIDTLAAIWTEGGAGPRVEALAKARAIAPSAARAWLESTWATEKADDRTLFVHALAIGLTAEDEPFLESTLDDRSSRVRATAHELLARIPGSKFVARMRDRSILKRTKTGFAVSDPPPDPRDHLTSGPELRSLRVLAVITATPLVDHQLRLEATPLEIVSWARKTHEAAALAEGWTRAAAREKNVEWAEALWDFWIAATEKIADEAVTRACLLALIALLPGPQAVRRVIDVLEKAAESRPVAAFLLALPQPWPALLTDKYLAAVLRAQDSTDSRATELMSALAHAVRSFAPDDLPRALAALPEGGGRGPWRHSLAEAQNLIALRREILEETKP